MSCIANGPNFRVKSIADSANVRTQTLFSHVFNYRLPFLLPIRLLIGWLSL